MMIESFLAGPKGNTDLKSIQQKDLHIQWNRVFRNFIIFDTAYGVYISQLIQYTKACFAYEDVSKGGKLFTKNLMLQG
jgi:hypothetical protein